MSDSYVLFVDDEQSILSSLKRLLIREAYHKDFVLSGEKALAYMAHNPVHVVVTDMRMPGMDGLTLLRTIKERYPNVIRIALTAHTSIPQVLAAINTGEVYRYLTKPLNPPDEIINVIQQAIELFELRRTKQNMMAALAKRNRELEEKIAHITRLEQLLPICSGCKKIRDQEGHWHPIEEYITQRTSTLFSHGICPDCIQRLYPDIYPDEANGQS